MDIKIIAIFWGLTCRLELTDFLTFSAPTYFPLRLPFECLQYQLYRY